MDVPTRGQVDKHEDVKLDEDREAEEDGVQEEAGQTQPAVQSPLVQMDPEDLRTGETRPTNRQSRVQLGFGGSDLHPEAFIRSRNGPEHGSTYGEEN